jgi:hypothetical protein
MPRVLSLFVHFRCSSYYFCCYLPQLPLHTAACWWCLTACLHVASGLWCQQLSVLSVLPCLVCKGSRCLSCEGLHCPAGSCAASAVAGISEPLPCESMCGNLQRIATTANKTHLATVQCTQQLCKPVRFSIAPKGFSCHNPVDLSTCRRQHCLSDAKKLPTSCSGTGRSARLQPQNARNAAHKHTQMYKLHNAKQQQPRASCINPPNQTQS